jgi:hypothetical protein
MNKYSIALLFLLCSSVAFAQTESGESAKKSFSKPSRDYVMLQIGYENWNNTPDSIKISGFNRVANAYVCYDFPISKSNFSFAAGVGIGTSNIYFKNQIINLSDTTAAIQFLPETTPAYKKYKLTTAYIEAPFELRYFGNKENRNKGFKAAIGLKIGALVSSHTKGKYTYNSKPIVDKVVTKRYLETWRYSPTLRLGYGNFSIYGQYALNNLFRVNSGPENIRPFQFGITLSGL